LRHPVAQFAVRIDDAAKARRELVAVTRAPKLRQDHREEINRRPDDGKSEDDVDPRHGVAAAMAVIGAGRLNQEFNCDSWSHRHPRSANYGTVLAHPPFDQDECNARLMRHRESLLICHFAGARA